MSHNQTEKEEWRPTPWREDYEVSSLGRVRHGDLIMKQHITPNGYPSVSFGINGKKTRKSVHRMVCVAFLGDRPDMTVNHINGIKTDNRLSNLEWATLSENQLHAVRTGLSRHHRGEAHHSAKLTESDVRDIVDQRKSGELLRVIGKKYGVRESCISRILSGARWKNLGLRMGRKQSALT